MLSCAPINLTRPSGDENKQLVIHSSSPPEDQEIIDLPLPKEKDISIILKALSKGKTKTYFEKIKLAFDNSTLLLPFLFANGFRRFWEILPKLQATMENNIYYLLTLPPEVRTAVAYDGATVSSEAFAITTPLVLASIHLSLFAICYQVSRYHRNQMEMIYLINLLNEKNYKNANDILYYALSRQQIETLFELVENDKMDENTIIEATPSRWETFASDMQWFNGELSKYTTPLIALSTIPGFVFLYRAASDLDGKIDCGMFPLWALFFDGCSVLEQYEVMSLLTYMWDCLSFTWLASRSIAMTSRFALIPFPNARQWFHEQINKPYAEWWNNEDAWVYNSLVWRTLFSFAMPAVIGYSLYSAGNFVNRYAEQTGCIDIWHIIAAFFTGNQSSNHQCTTTQLSMAISGFLGDFEIGKLYAAYMVTEVLSSLIAFVMKRLPTLQREGTIESAKAFLRHLTTIQNHSLVAAFAGVILGGMIGFIPAQRVANEIIQEGFEVFYHFDNITLPSLQNITIPDNLPDMSIPGFIPISPTTLTNFINFLSTCTIYTNINFPGVVLPGNMTIPGFNLTLPCIEIIDSSTIGIQITPPCPNYNIFSIFLRNLIGLSIDCDPVLVIRAIAGFVAPYWLSVSSSSVFSAQTVATALLIAWAVKSLKDCCRSKPSSTPSTKPHISLVNDDEMKHNRTELIEINDLEKGESRNLFSPRFFRNQTEQSSISFLQNNRFDFVDENKQAEEEKDNDDEKTQSTYSYITGYFHKLYHFFKPAQTIGVGYDEPLLNNEYSIN